MNILLSVALLFLGTVELALAEDCADRPGQGKFCQAYKEFASCSNHKINVVYCKKTCGICGGTTTTQGPPPGSCGTRQISKQKVKVIGGEDARKGDWPWQIVMLRWGRMACGGTLISDQWVVTAAHCIPYLDATIYTVRVGEHDRDVTEGTEVDVKVEKVVKHPGWSFSTLSNDIALLKLASKVKFTKYVQPICMPSGDATIGDRNCYITGWGKIKFPGNTHNYLQQAVMPPVDSMICQKKNEKKIAVPITKAMLCAGEGGINSISGCHGDSGGPYVCFVKGRWELHGAVSHGSRRCNSTDTYTVFARVNYFKKWIQEEMHK